MVKIYKGQKLCLIECLSNLFFWPLRRRNYRIKQAAYGVWDHTGVPCYEIIGIHIWEVKNVVFVYGWDNIITLRVLFFNLFIFSC